MLPTRRVPSMIMANKPCYNEIKIGNRLVWAVLNERNGDYQQT